MRTSLAFLLCLALLCTLHSKAFAATPLLQDGKKTLYQRVITHPHAQILQSPEANAKKVQDNVKPFTVFYVYAKQNGWLQVGPLGATPLGWLEETKSTAWNQSLTLLFTDRTSRNPLLFFKNEQGLMDICTSTQMEKTLADIQKAVLDKNQTVLDGAQVVATEPTAKEGAVNADRFYLMPILAMNDPFEGVKFLEVASIDPGSEKSDAKKTTPRTAIAFVIDTTISMKPYIDQSLNVIRSVYDQLEGKKLHDDVAFGVVAFRSSPEAKPGTEYESRVVSDLVTAKDRAMLETELAKVKEASSSTHTFTENSPSGIKMALDSLSWGDYTTRMLIVITDAGPLPPSDPYATVKMDMPELADYARTKGVRVTALHIKSPKGKKDHAEAEQAYRLLTRLSDNRSNYLTVKASTTEEGVKNFTTASSALTSGIVNMVQMTLDGKLITKPADETGKNLSAEEEAKNMAAALGYAMQLEFFGKVNETRAPSVKDSWIADMDLQKLAKGEQASTVEVAVLLTKNQLNDLSQQLSIIIDNAERTKKTDAKDFFQGILSASTRAARDPNSPMPAGQNLSQLGVLGEFLEGLPYKSDIMLLREEDWYRMSIGQQTTFINRLKSRLARYEEYDKDRSHWESFGATNPGDWMYRVPLTMLP